MQPSQPGQPGQLKQLKILLVRVSSLGDVLHNLPMVADIVRHHPGALIDWVVEEGYVSLVRLNPHVRTIIPFALRRWRKRLAAKATRLEVAAFVRRLRAERLTRRVGPRCGLRRALARGPADGR